MSGYGTTFLVISGLGLVLAAPAFAQTNLESNAGIQFNFSPPGAANLALGGAYLALADDATTAYTNPAGLTQLYQDEVHLEARRFTFTHVFTDGDQGRLVEGRADDTTAGPSFLSYVHPFKRWTLAVYRHELARFEANFDTEGALLRATRLGSPLGLPGELDGRLARLDSTMNLDIVNLGVSLAWLVGDLSLGLGLSYYSFSLDSTAERTIVVGGEELFDGRPANEQTQIGDDHDFGLTLGFLWQSPRERWTAGGVFRRGPSFAFEAKSRHVAAPGLFPDVTQEGRFHVPDVYGVGIAFKPSDAVRITVDYDRVEYSDLTQDFVDIFGLDRFFPSETVSAELDRFVIDDAGEVHAGFEYFFIRKHPIVVRLGAWYDPDHTLRFDGENPSFDAIFQPRGDEMHYTLGFGFSMKNVHLAAAYDHSDRVRTGSLSATWYF